VVLCKNVDQIVKIDDELFEAIDFVELRTGLQILEVVRALPEFKRKIVVTARQRTGKPRSTASRGPLSRD
jgi:hypothetical protein